MKEKAINLVILHLASSMHSIIILNLADKEVRQKKKREKQKNHHSAVYSLLSKRKLSILLFYIEVWENKKGLYLQWGKTTNT